MNSPVIAFGQQPCGFFPRRFLFAKILAARRLQAELLQAQKMEAVGRLAGGVAHDFNNLLTVIATSVDFLLTDTPADDPRREDVLAIADAAGRSATLTRQLLAFSRRQVVQPRAFDVAELATRADRMLRRLVGEDVAMTLRAPGTTLRTSARRAADLGIQSIVAAYPRSSHSARNVSSG